MQDTKQASPKADSEFQWFKKLNSKQDSSKGAESEAENQSKYPKTQ